MARSVDASSMMKHLVLVVALGVMGTGCIEGDDPGPMPSPNVSCTPSASIYADPASGTDGEVFASGSLQCDGVGNLSVEACVQWRDASSSTFTELGCGSASRYSTYAEEKMTWPCATVAGKVYRTRVHVSLNGGEVVESFSNEVTCH